MRTITAILLSSVAVIFAEESTLPLAGTWRFRLDAGDVGVKEKWFAQTFDDTVQLQAFARRTELDGKLLDKLLPGNTR